MEKTLCILLPSPNMMKVGELKLQDSLLNRTNEKGRPEALSMQQKAKLPWFKRVHYSPLALAIQNKSEQLALFFLSLDSVYFVAENDENYLLYLAIEYGCLKLANETLDIVDERSMTHLLTLHGGITVLHVAPKCSGQADWSLSCGLPFLVTFIILHWVNVNAS